MTYDPRAGASPYLGMDDYDELDQDGLMVDVEDDLEIEDPFSQDGTMAMDPNQVPKTVRRSFEPPRRGVAPRDQGTSPLGTGPIIRRPAAQETGPAPRVSQDTTVHAATASQFTVDSFKASLVSQLETTYIVDEKGNKKKVTRKGKK